MTIGSHSYFDDEFDHSESLCARAAAIEKTGKSAVLVP